MKLQVFNAANCRQRQVSMKTLMSLDFKTGVFRLSKPLIELMGVKKLDQVAIAYDEEENEWYLFKTNEDGFILRAANGSDENAPLIFNNAKTANSISKHIPDFADVNGRVIIGKEPVIHNDIAYWPIIVSSFNPINKPP